MALLAVERMQLHPGHALMLSALQGVAARQHDAWDLGMVSSDDFTNADVRYEQSFANIRASLTRTNGGPQEIPIVTGFLARGENTGIHPATEPHPPQ